MKRKYAWSLVGLLLFTSTGFAQTEIGPKEEFRATASTTSIRLKKGQQDSAKISVVRSKSFKTGKAALSFNPPSEAGLKSMKQHPERPDEFMVCLSASRESKTGEYNFAPTCSLRNKNKGIVLELIIE